MKATIPIKSVIKQTLNIFKSEIGIPIKESYKAIKLVSTIECKDNLYR